MKKSKKILSVFLALAMLVSMALPVMAASQEGTGVLEGTQDLINDRPETTTLIVHKLQAKSYKDVPRKHNGGLLTEDQLKTLGTDVTELDGVTFTYYKVSQEQLTAMLAKPADYDTTGKVEGLVPAPTKLGTITTAGGKGASVDLEEGFYWFVESDKPENVSSAVAVPFGISLPLSQGSQYLKTVHVYPKNVTGDNPTPDKTVDDMTNKTSSHNVGDTVSWFLQATVPANIKDYVMLKMTDTFSPSLTYKGNVVVKYGAGDDFDKLGVTLTEGTDYTITQPNVGNKGGDLEIALTNDGIAKLAKNYVEGGKVVAKVDTAINEDAIMGLEIPNDYTLHFKNNPNSEEKTENIPKDKQPKVVTGGKKFKKVDGQTPLENAVFQLLDGKNEVKWTEDLITANKTAIEAGQFAVKGQDGKYTATTATTDVKAGDSIYLRSNKDGLFEIKGLEYSKWQREKWDATAGKLVNDGDPVTHDWNLKEVQAPDGYALLKEAVGFVIDKTSYYKDPSKVDLGVADPELIQNTKLTIPQTGGMGTVLFVAVGLALMAGAVIAMKRRSSMEG